MNSKKNEKYLVITLLISMLSFSSCEDAISPSSIITTSEITVGDFNSISVSSAFDVEVFDIEAGEEYILIESNENIHQYIEVYQEGGALNIGLDNINISGGTTILKARVYTSTSIGQIKASGASRVTVMDELISDDNVNLVLLGASFLKAEINTQSIGAVIQGASNMELEGSVNMLDLEISGASRIQDESLEVNIAHMDLSGASNVTLTINQEIWLTASGASTLKYNGDASIKAISLEGASTLEKI